MRANNRGTTKTEFSRVSNEVIKSVLEQTLLFSPISPHRSGQSCTTVHAYWPLHRTTVKTLAAATRSLNISRICQLTGEASRGRTSCDLAAGCALCVASRDQSADKRRTMRGDESGRPPSPLRLITSPFRTWPLLWLVSVTERDASVSPRRRLFFLPSPGYVAARLYPRFIKACSDVNERANCKPRPVSLCRLSRARVSRGLNGLN